MLRKYQHTIKHFLFSEWAQHSSIMIQMPTGTGKTIAALFPSIKAVGQQMADRIFYLTAKTVTRTVAVTTSFSTVRSVSSCEKSVYERP